MVNNYFKLLILSSCIMLLAVGCKGDEDNKEPSNAALAQLQGQWNATNVTKDDIEQEGFDNFILIITGDKVLQTYGDPVPVFPVGKFEFVSENSETVICQDIEVHLEVVDDTLTAFFTLYKEESGGRINATKGNYVFVLEAVN